MKPRRVFVYLLLVAALLIQGIVVPPRSVFAQEPSTPVGASPQENLLQAHRNPLPDPDAPVEPAVSVAPRLAVPAADPVEPKVSPNNHETTLKAGESDTFQISVETGSTPIGKADVMLVFDLTGSMGGEIGQAKASSLEIANAIRAQLPNSWFGVASFMDYPGAFDYPGYSEVYGSAGWGDVPWKLNLGPTDDLNAVQGKINELSLGSGEDWPEDYTRVLYELGQITNIGWRQATKKIVVLFGDAPTHDLDFAGYNFGGDPGPDGVAQSGDDLDFETVVRQLAAEQITVIAIDSGYEEHSEATFKGMSIGYGTAPGTKGQYYQLNNTADLPRVIVETVLGEAQTIDRLELQVTSGYESWVTFDPSFKLNVGANTTESFGVTIKPPGGTVPGYYPFMVRVMADGAMIGVTMVYVTIPPETPVTDLGFDPKVHGFGVNNFSTEQTWEMFRQFFGERQVQYADKTPIHAADKFFNNSYRTVGKGGTCDGFSALSLINFKRLAQPNAGAYALQTMEKLYEGTDSSDEYAKVRSALAYAQGIQKGYELLAHRQYSCERLQNSPKQYFYYLKSLLDNGSPAVLGLRWLKDPKKPPEEGNLFGHSVVPLRYEQPSADVADVYVYDNNWRGDSSFRLRFDLKNDQVRYEDTNRGLPDIVYYSWDQIKAAPCPRLAVAPLDFFLHRGVPFWEVPVIGSASGASSADTSMFQAYSSQGDALLLFENDSGQRFGWTGLEFTEEIPGASISADVTGAGEDAGSTFYTLPSDSSYKVWLVGTGAGRAGAAAWLGSTFVEVADVEVMTNTLLALNIADNGSTVGIGGVNAESSAALSINHILSDQDRTVTVEDVQVEPGQSVQMNYTLGGTAANALGTTAAPIDQISIVSTGPADSYNLSLHRGGAGGYSSFGASDILLQANTAHSFSVAEWSALDQVAIAADVGRDGAVDETIVAQNSAVSSVLEVSAPSEAVVGSQLDVTIRVRDQFGAYVGNGTVVTISTTGGTLSAVTGTTVGGLVHLKLGAPNKVGQAVVRATVGSVSSEATITFVPGAAAALMVQPALATLPADGLSTTSVRTRVADAFDNPISGANVAFATTMGTIASLAVTGVDGWAQTTMTSTLQVGIAKVTAQSGSATQVADVKFAGGTVRGVVYADLNRNGKRDSQEPPLVGMPVQVRADITGASWTANTEADGQFLFADLPLTNYVVTVGPAPGLHWTSPRTFALSLGIDGAVISEVGGSYLVFLPVTQR